MSLSVSPFQKSPSNPIEVPKRQQDNKDNSPVDHMGGYYFSLKDQLIYGPLNIKLEEGTFFYAVESLIGEINTVQEPELKLDQT